MLFRSGADQFVNALALQTDGKIVLGGGFLNIDGRGQNNISRITSNGRIDTSFNVGTGANDFVTSVLVQPDGKILLSGNFTIVDGVTNNHIARLNGGVNIGAGSFAFLSPTFSVAENGGSVMITVQRLGGATGAASVDFTTTDGTALANKDYTATAGSLNFGDGVLFQTFTVTALDNNILEGTRTLGLELSNPSLGTTLAPQSTATLDILDNDSILGFASPAFSVSENGVTATITLRRVGGTVGVVGISYAVSNGTATAGIDYTNTFGSVSWADGDGADKTFRVGIIDKIGRAHV